MKKEEILKVLKNTTSNGNLRFPKELGIESNEGILTITLKQKGLHENMQTDSAAFEGWAITIKAIVPEIAKKVIIQWNGLGLENGVKSNHYRRFLYRVLKFEQSYKWVSAMPLDTKAENDLSTLTSELSQWVVNYPDSESQDKASKGEAQLERNLKENLSKKFKNSDHQLPVGLFFLDKNKRNERTPRQGSQIDLWSISGDTFTVYELKNDDNRKIGIISELMFYVNVIKDLSEQKLHFAKGADKSIYRSFKTVYDAISSESINKVVGVFLTNDLHAIIKIGREEVFTLLNHNTRRIEYKQMGYKISEIYEIKK